MSIVYHNSQILSSKNWKYIRILLSVQNAYFKPKTTYSKVQNALFCTFFMPKQRKNAWKNRRSRCGKVEKYEMAVFRWNTEFYILRPTVNSACFFLFSLDKICILCYTVCKSTICCSCTLPIGVLILFDNRKLRVFSQLAPYQLGFWYSPQLNTRQVHLP